MRKIIKILWPIIGVTVIVIAITTWQLKANSNHNEKYSTYSLEQINDGSWKKGDITFNSIVLKDSDYE